MLFVGTQTNDPNKRIEIDFDGLLHHTLVVGQSGSGKSFLVARLIEEILVRSKARVLVIDPNGDFRRISMPSLDVWGKFNETFQKLNTLTEKSGIKSFDTQVAFKDGWKIRQFIYLSPGLPVASNRDGAVDHRLVVHWDTLEDEQRSFSLRASASTEPKIFLGLKAVAENAKWIQGRPDVQIKMDLRGLLEIAKQFADSNINMRQYEYAKILNRDDWSAVQAKIDDLLSQYSIWWSSDRTAPRPPGLADFIDGAFEQNRKLRTFWDALVLSLEAASPPDTLLAADVALSRLWLKTKGEWRARAESLQLDADNPDKRVPTFIVVDEAHNFAPEEPSDPLRARVTARLMQIASEGRKYGLYLILATQRPTKLHRELVAECENACVLRLQSKIETDFAVKVLGLSEAEAHSVPTFTKGQGVFFGRWVGGTAQMNTKIAPARIVVGGGEIGGDWKTIPDPTLGISEDISSITEFIEKLLQDSDSALDLAGLAGRIRNKFGAQDTANWFGFYTFKEFLASLGIPNLALATIPPGYAYLKGKHPVPLSEPQVHSLLEATQPSADIKAVSHAEKSIANLLRDKLKTPILPRPVFEQIFEATASEVQINEFNLTDTSKAIRARCAAAGLPVARSAINYVLKGISLGGHNFDRDLPQSPSILANAFVKSLLYGLKRHDVISPEIEDAIRDFYSGGILSDKTVVEFAPTSQGPKESLPKANLTDVPIDVSKKASL